MFVVNDCHRRAYINRSRALPLVALLALAGGCGPSEPTGSQAEVPQPTAAELALLELGAGFSNQLAAARSEQADLIRQLSERVRELEDRGSQQAAIAASLREAHEALANAYRAQTNTHSQEVQQFTSRIHELEGELESLLAGKLLPEIVVPPADEPTPVELDQKIRVLERRNELAMEDENARRREAPRFQIGEQGISFESADTNFTVRLRGLVQLDSRSFLNDDPYSEGNETFALRRARPIIEGTLFRDFDFQVVPDFGGSSAQIFDANLTYRIAPELRLRAGKFKGPVGLEHSQDDASLPFNERSMVSGLVPTRSVGVQLSGDLAGGKVSYAAGVFNVAGDARNPSSSDFGDDKEFAGRLLVRPFKDSRLEWLKNLGLGVSGSYSQTSSNVMGLPGTTGGSLPGYVTPALQQFFAYNPIAGTVVADGAHWRISPHLQYTWGPVGLLAEYIVSRQGVYNSATFRSADLEHTAWQVSGQWVLTGEPASFSGIVPRRSFDPRNGGWGAWQLVGRIGQLDIDDAAFQGFANPATSASAATSWSVGVNWWLNRNVRVLTSFNHTSFEGGGAPASAADPGTLFPPASTTRQDENAFLTRLQVAF